MQLNRLHPLDLSNVHLHFSISRFHSVCASALGCPVFDLFKFGFAVYGCGPSKRIFIKTIIIIIVALHTSLSLSSELSQKSSSSFCYNYKRDHYHQNHHLQLVLQGGALVSPRAPPKQMMMIFIKTIISIIIITIKIIMILLQLVLQGGALPSKSSS